ncbi:hypothetical protein GH714_043048 [Hevea brasiliensis]|uniref:dTMP kinase n=1 Tax=Hevea brasiliensis TaxID=3981 RepID=A0A6A6K157_HEVBR|nr:hypothetical protein GH714_043048 [Hevea brasiliensis]
MLFMAMRRESFVRVVSPGLLADKIVISDRFTDSTVAYQGYGCGVNLTLVSTLNSLVANVVPDITFVMDVSTELALARTSLNGCESRSPEFYDRVREGFKAIVADNPHRCHMIDCTEDSAEDVYSTHDKIVALFNEMARNKLECGGCAVWSIERGFFAWFSVAVFFALQYVLRVIPNTLSGEIMERFGVGAIAFGQFSALYYAGYTIAHIPLGVLIDKYGPKKVVPACMALTFLGATPMLFDSWKLVQIGRVLTGIGSVAAAVSIFKVSKMYFAGTKVARMVSIAVVIGLLGAMYGGMPMLSLVEDFDWSRVFLTFIVGGCALAALAYFLFDGAGATGSVGVYEQVRSVISNKRLVIINLLGGA